MNFLLLLLAISAFLGAMISVAIVTFLIAALIWHFFPESAIGRWIIDTFIEPVFVNVEKSIKVGDCISPKTNMIGAKNGAV